MNNTIEFYTSLVKQYAHELGFMACGISKAEKLEEEETKLANWLNKGYQGKMKYLENNFDKRLDPTKLVEGSKSVISLLYNYFPNTPVQNSESETNKIAKYAYGEDYHTVIKEKLKEFVSKLKITIGDFNARVFVDSAPVMERQWAQKSGIGWIGKNGLLLRKKEGSFFFIAQIICDLTLQSDGNNSTSHCGTCTACIDACPTDAILLNNVLDSTKCISYLTIELKENIPSIFDGKLDNWIYGCDICQDVCPWNSFSKAHSENKFNSLPYTNFKDKDWLELTEMVFNPMFEKSAIKRIGFAKLKHNIEIARKKPLK